ncbi:D-alanyl-D-alanine carboxypeptidase/D-alanyl-D-alanine-endopeptidase [Autumnicola musiva]|uniref:D-alanyl-D-alanine carboxypeptidase n=1 Tax=Autumnicola musiva TaxID=3075589 RepID=A0ABU3D2H1_9FLAO|nr:D-alanyl-D-alanine carboxypeptidase [Zunongwangia sp. F117]MDT0675733.1 D-alanyl-D-alanine carboxypeptidase [Zunongwangia sp. F117]
MAKNLYRSMSPLKFLILSLIFLMLGSCSTTKKISRPINNIFTGSPVFDQGFAGLALYDPQENKTIYSYNAKKYFTPASNTKLFTFYTGLKILGDSVPALKYLIENDTLYFKATGDPSFLNRNLPESEVFYFLKNSNEKLVYIPPSYTETHQGPGWSWGDYNAYYSAERTPFPVYGNMVSFQFQKNKKLPVVSPSIFSDSLVNIKDNLVSSRIERKIFKNSFEFNNQFKNSEFAQSVPFKYSPEILTNLLSDTLHKPVIRLENLDINKRLNKTLYSISSDSLYKRMLEVSDNFIAEQILIMSAGIISDTLKSDIAIDYMKEHYLADLPDEPMWYDGSGLSRYNLFTPRTMVKLLEKILAEVPQEKLFSIMATGGKSGTLKNYFKAEHPYIFAKTGTLKYNHSLSGYIKTNSGKILIFSFMNSNYTVSTSLLKQEMERILKIIRNNY